MRGWFLAELNEMPSRNTWFLYPKQLPTFPRSENLAASADCVLQCHFWGFFLYFFCWVFFGKSAPLARFQCSIPSLRLPLVYGMVHRMLVCERDDGEWYRVKSNCLTCLLIPDLGTSCQYLDSLELGMDPASVCGLFRTARCLHAM